MNKKFVILYAGILLTIPNLQAIPIRLPMNPTQPEQESLKLLRRVLPETARLRTDDQEIKAIRLSRLPAGTPSDTYAARVKHGILLLEGAGNRGLIYATSAFLERSMGVRIWSMTAQHWPQPTPLKTIEKPSWYVTPAFLWRDNYNSTNLKHDDGIFAVFNRLNRYGDQRIDARYGGALTFGSPYHVHTFAVYLPASEFFAKHPEYYALKGNKRQAGPQSQLCLSNPKVREILLERLKQNILADEARNRAKHLPPPRIYCLGRNDNNTVCGCTDCQKIIADEGGRPSGILLRTINDLARQIRTFRPNVYLSTLAYFNTEYPPLHEKPEANVIIRLCDTTANNYGGILAPEHHQFRRKIELWHAAGAPNIYVWHYSKIYGLPHVPYPSEFNYPELFRYFRANNVRCVFLEHERPEQSDMHAYKSYLEAKLMDNPDADFTSLCQDFLNGYYGAAGHYVWNYRKRLRQAVLRQKAMGFVYATMTGPASFLYLDADTVRQSLTLIRQAEQAVAHTPEKLDRVRQLRIGLDKAIVLYCRTWSATQPKLPKELDRDEALREARELVTTSIRKRYIEKAWEQEYKTLDKEMSPFATLPATTSPLRQFAAQERRIDLLPELTRFHNNPIVPDVDSETGYAIQVDKPSFDCLTGGGYNCAESQAQPLKNKVLITRKHVKGPGYHWYKLHEFVPVPEAYLYFLSDWTIQIPQDGPAAKMRPRETWELYVRAKFTGFGITRDKDGIFLDRFVLVPKGNYAPLP